MAGTNSFVLHQVIDSLRHAYANSSMQPQRRILRSFRFGGLEHRVQQEAWQITLKDILALWSWRTALCKRMERPDSPGRVVNVSSYFLFS